jgi:SNF2 family DNA or RNA helicase
VPLDDDAWLHLQDDLVQSLEELRAVVGAQKPPKQEGGPVTVPEYAALALEGTLESAGTAERDPAWQELVHRIESTRKKQPPQLPEALARSLRPYQKQAFEWMARLSAWGAGACLADDMGLGKTIQAIAMLRQRASTGPQLVLAPTSVVWNWQRELEAWAAKARVRRFEGPNRLKALEDLGPNDMVLASHAILVRNSDALAQVEWATVVLDEAQAMKNADSRRAKALRELPCQWRLALSGTPVENHLEELWALFDWLVPGLLGTRQGFKQAFRPTGDPEVDAAQARSVARLVEPFILRRTKAQVAPELS